MAGLHDCWHLPLQGRADPGNVAGQGQRQGQNDDKEGSSIQEGSVRGGADVDAESSANSLLSPTLGQSMSHPLSNAQMPNLHDSSWITQLAQTYITRSLKNPHTDVYLSVTQALFSWGLVTDDFM